MCFAGQRVADSQTLVADVGVHCVHRLPDERMSLHRLHRRQAASSCARQSDGDWPYRRPNARAKLALLR